jgi:hypothetical protein
MGKTYALKDAGVMLEDVGKEVRAAASRGLLAAAHRTVAHIVGSIIPSLPHPPVDRDIYRAAWRAKKDGDGAVVENLAPHAGFIEYGVRAGSVKQGRAMIDALTEWVKRKGIGGRTVTSAGGKTRHVKASDAEARGIAWAIAKSMQKRGIFGPKGLRVLEKAGKMIPTFIDQEVAREMKAIGR